MTPRLVTARTELRRLIARYVPSHVHAKGSEALHDAANELEDAARECGDPLSNPPVTLLTPEQQTAALIDALPPVYSAPPIPNAVGEPVFAPIPNAVGEPRIVPLDLNAENGERVTGMLPALGADFEPAPPPADALPTVGEAVADALAPYQAPPVPEADGPVKAKAKRSK